jgi:hypothetical protein
MKPQGECVAGADVTVWDVAGALRRLDGDEELLHEVVGIFLEDIPVHLATLRRVLSARLRSVRPGRHGSEAVTLRHPVMPVANGLGRGLVGINGDQL